MPNLDEKINIYGIAPGSIVDGPGIRFGIFVQGCSHHCPGCHNPKSQARVKGIVKSVADILLEYEKSPSCIGVTLSGGEPFEQSKALAELAQAFQEKRTNVWCYTGYLFEDLYALSKGIDADGATEYCNSANAKSINKLLGNIDVLVDGEFKESQKSYEALYRGSKNQRLIDVKKSLSQNKIILWTQEFELPIRPKSW